ncbi:MAG: endolytic transglycosylase MltG, partial [Proteobacteria bacterium]
LLAVPAWQLGYFKMPGEGVAFIVGRGENFAGIAKRLQESGVISSERAFRYYVNFTGPRRKLQRGEFGLYRNMPVPEVVRALSEGKPLQHPLTVPEGYNLFQIASVIEGMGMQKKEDFMKAARDPEVIAMIPTVGGGKERPTSIEGYIFPDTYMVQRVFSAKEIAQAMVQRFREVYKIVQPELQASATVQSLGLTPHQVITLASIVEKETGNGSERPLIASIFVNRLRKRMRLQTDPTVIYGVWEATGAWDGNIRRKDLNTPTPYNTYQMEGLPPGPIANPGLNAIRAVLQPSTSEYYFFVSRGDGTHIFSKEYSDHAKAVRDTQLTPGAKEGKSWRNLPSEQRAH